MTIDARNDLDRAITRATQAGYLEQLRLLKDRQISPKEFLEAARSNRLLTLKPAHALRPLVERWLQASDLRESSRARYRQSWNFLFKSLPPNATTATLTTNWWATFVQTRCGLTTSTLNRDRAALLAFVGWSREHGYEVGDVKTKRLKEEPNRSDILSPDQVDAVCRLCRADRWPFFWMLLDTGARQGEVLNLRAGDIGVGADIVTFRSRPGSKSRGRERHVPVSPAVGDAPAHARFAERVRSPLSVRTHYGARVVG